MKKELVSPKVPKKKVSHEKVFEKKVSHEKAPAKSREIEKVLIENFVSLQKIMTHHSARFDILSTQISELLKLFEDSAKILVKGELTKKKEDRGDKQLLETMISVLDQNKVIAKGLTLMYEHMTESEGGRDFQPSPVTQVPQSISEFVPEPVPQPTDVPSPKRKPLLIKEGKEESVPISSRPVQSDQNQFPTYR